MTRALARPIKTARDRKGAAAIARNTRKHAEREPDAERRLQALLHEIQKFDNEGEAEEYDDSAKDMDGLPRRRWSDDPADEA